MTTIRCWLRVVLTSTVLLLIAGKAEAFLFWADLPQSAFPATIELTFPTPVDVTWTAALSVAQQEGVLITAEQDAGVLVYSKSQESPPIRTYVNVLLRQSGTTAGTVVYVLPHGRGGVAPAGVDHQFFEKLRTALEVKYVQ